MFLGTTCGMGSGFEGRADSGDSAGKAAAVRASSINRFMRANIAHKHGAQCIAYWTTHSRRRSILLLMLRN